MGQFELNDKCLERVASVGIRHEMELVEHEGLEESGGGLGGEQLSGDRVGLLERADADVDTRRPHTRLRPGVHGLDLDVHVSVESCELVRLLLHDGHKRENVDASPLIAQDRSQHQ